MYFAKQKKVTLLLIFFDLLFGYHTTNFEPSTRGQPLSPVFTVFSQTSPGTSLGASQTDWNFRPGQAPSWVRTENL